MTEPSLPDEIARHRQALPNWMGAVGDRRIPITEINAARTQEGAAVRGRGSALTMAEMNEARTKAKKAESLKADSRQKKSTERDPEN